jgi:hypothetical protein
MEPTVTTTKASRRDFVGSVAAAGTAFTIVPRHLLGGPGYTAPSDRLNIVCLGVGGMGESDVKGVSGQNIYALCDVDPKASEDTFRKYPNAKKYRDYREMLNQEQKNIDAVTITIPDYGHAAATMMALRLNKNVYCQKPLARTLTEVRTVRAQAARTKVATQMGNQGHAGDAVRILREWIEAGVIGTVREVQYWTNRPIWPQGLDRPTDLHVPPPRWTGTSGSARHRSVRTIRPTPRSGGAAGGTSAPGPWATWPATAWTPPTGSSTWATRRGSCPRPPSASARRRRR